jgi:hypothetical protein
MQIDRVEDLASLWSQTVGLPIARGLAFRRYVSVRSQDRGFPRCAETPNLLPEPIPDERRVSRSEFAGVVSAEPLYDRAQALEAINESLEYAGAFIGSWGTTQFLGEPLSNSESWTLPMSCWRQSPCPRVGRRSRHLNSWALAIVASERQTERSPIGISSPIRSCNKPPKT